MRPTGITYPNGTAITTDYVASLSSAISRPDAIKESTTTLASFRYLGLGTVVDLNYDAASNAHLTVVNGGAADMADKYTGLDRLGRLVETIGKHVATNGWRSGLKWGRFAP